MVAGSHHSPPGSDSTCIALRCFLGHYSVIIPKCFFCSKVYLVGHFPLKVVSLRPSLVSKKEPEICGNHFINADIPHPKFSNIKNMCFN